MAFPDLPPFIKDAMEDAMDEARKAAKTIAEKEHEIEEELKTALDSNENVGIQCSDQNSWRSKANKVKNWFRKLVGLALVQRSECTESGQVPIRPSEGQDDILRTYHVVTEENSVPVPPPVAIAGNAGAPCHKNTGSAASGPVIAMMVSGYLISLRVCPPIANPRSS
jgi:hypothetical protein